MWIYESGDKMKYIVVPSIDRSEWLKWRHKGIGSSDASVIMGVSRFKTPEQLMIEKSGPCLPESGDNNYIKERGNRIEAITRSLLEAKRGYSLAACNTYSATFEFIKASLDGCNHDRKIITEIKLLSSQSREKFNRGTEGYQKWSCAKLQGIVPEEYIPQIQHQLFVTGFDQCIFAGVCEVRGQVLDGDSIAQVIVERDNDYIKKMIAKECEFWYNISQLTYGGELE